MSSKVTESNGNGGKRPTKPRKWARTVDALGEELGISSRPNVYKWLRKDGFPQKTKRGYNVEKCVEYVRQAKEASANKLGGPHGDLKREKLRVEIQILEAKRDALRDAVVPIDEYRAELSAYAAMVNGVFGLWVNEVAAMTRDVALLRRAKDLRDRAMARLLERVDEL